jgi:putative alpha-1,2-mannosidase
MFPHATVHFGNGRTLVVEHKGRGVYVTAIALNGQPYNNLWLPLDKIPTNATTTLEFTTHESAPTSTTLHPPPAFITKQ